MLLSSNMTGLLNKQLAKEQENHFKYMAMASLSSKHNLVGFEKFFLEQAKGEREHYDKIYKYMSDKNANIKILTANGTTYTGSECLKDMKALAEKFYETEISTTKALYDIYADAHDEGDFSTAQFLFQYLIEEQVEEEALALNFKAEVERCVDTVGLNLMDMRLR